MNYEQKRWVRERLRELDDECTEPTADLELLIARVLGRDGVTYAHYMFKCAIKRDVGRHRRENRRRLKRFKAEQEARGTPVAPVSANGPDGGGEATSTSGADSAAGPAEP